MIFLRRKARNQEHPKRPESMIGKYGRYLGVNMEEEFERWGFALCEEPIPRQSGGKGSIVWGMTGRFNIESKPGIIVDVKGNRDMSMDFSVPRGYKIRVIWEDFERWAFLETEEEYVPVYYEVNFQIERSD